LLKQKIQLKNDLENIQMEFENEGFLEQNLE